MPSKIKPSERTALRYIISLTAVATAVLIRGALDPILGDSFPLITLFGAVGVAVWFAGGRPAAVAALLGYVLCAYFFMPPRGELGLHQTSNTVGLLAYIFTCSLMIGFGEYSGRAKIESEMQRELLRVTMASMGDAVITTDKTARITSLNTVAETLTGWTGHEAQGEQLERIFRIVNEYTRQSVPNPAFRALHEGIIVGLANHTILVRKDGSELPIEDSAAPIINSMEETVGCVLIFRDVTEKRRLERAIEVQLSAAQFLASIVESSEDAIISKSLDGIIQSWNRAAERLFGYSAEEIIGQSVLRLIPPERIGEEEEIIGRLETGERVEHFETMRVRKDGQLVHVSLTVSPIRNEAGEIIGASKIARDITDQKKSEMALIASERELADFFENAVIGLHWVGPDGIILRANQADCELLGYSLDEYVGQHIAKFHADQSVIDDILKRLNNREVIHDYPARLLCKDGSIKDVLIDSSVLWQDDRFIHTRCFTRDVTAQKAAEEALRQADRRKDEFLAMLAHELRNPLAPLKNSLEIMKRSPSDPTIVEQSSATMERQLGQMIRLIDDLLDLSRVSRNDLELRKEVTEIQSVILHVIESCKPIIENSGHELSVRLPKEPFYVFGDPVRLSQIFGNLLTNACKYTDEKGRIELDLSVRGDKAVITLSDSGIGIPPELTERVFEMFVQVDRSLERSQGGLGIGLTLVKTLVDLHGGRVSAFSEGLGKGSTFTVELPVETNAKKAPAINSVPKLKGAHRILIVDDNRDSAETLATLLKLCGNETAAAHDGEEAIHIAESFKPALMFLDIGLPKKNGYVVCQSIRQHEWGRDIFIVAMTGWGQDEDRRKSNESGFNAHLVKPIAFDEVSAILRRLES